MTDFGLARMAEASIKITTSGTVMGTPAYMSPEQGAGSTIDHRSDIYSLGIILYEMVTGRVPYIAETPVAVVFKHIQDPLPSPRKLKPDLSEAIELVLLKALAKSPNDRYQTAYDFIQAIYKAIPETSPEEKSPAQMPTISTRPAPELKPVSTAVSVQAVKSRTGVIKYALIGVVVLSILAAGVWGIRFLSGRDEPTTEEAVAIFRYKF